MPGGVVAATGYPEPPQTGPPIRLPGPHCPDPDSAHRTRTSLEPIGYDSQGAPLYAWQLDVER
jgi:hypothetical protein